MGRATIVSNKGYGLYTARPLFDTTALDSELAKLQAQETEYAALLLSAFNSLTLLENDVSITKSAMDAIIQQWLDKVISKGNEVPPELTPPDPIDPETGFPWEDPDRAQEEPLLTAINAARTAASVPTLSRQSDLDKAALEHMRWQSYSSKMGHTSNFTTPVYRVQSHGYSASVVKELLNYGGTSPSEVVSTWNRDSKTALLDATIEDCGIAYVYSTHHIGNHLWCAVLCKPGTPPPEDSFTTTNPVQQKSNEEESQLDKIPVPKTNSDQPEKLETVAAQFAQAKAKAIVAEKELERLQLEKLQRITRIAELTALKTALAAIVVDVWACYYNTDLSVGDVVYTAEIPGYWSNTSRFRTVVVFGKSILWEERLWNIVPRYTGFDSRIKPTTTIREDATFYDVALEPPTLKWKPAWRYGTITDITGSTCTIKLDAITARRYPNTRDIKIVENNESISEVPFNYPPCNNLVFYIGDEVLIRYKDFNYLTPEVVGFRYAPRNCANRTSWRELI